MASETIGIAWWAFDIVIAVFLIGVGILVAEIIARAKGRWSAWRWAAMVMLCGAWTVIFYGSFVEPRLLRDREVLIKLVADAPAGTARIAVLSDIHVGPYKHERWVRRVVHRINELDPDAVLIAGDFVSARSEEAEMLAPLADINAPVYAVIGNHDHQFADPDAVEAALERFDVTVLRDEAVQVVTTGAIFNVVGIDDWWFGPDLDSAFEGVHKGIPTIAFTHNPDVILAEHDAAYRADVLIAGHTHCGQIRLPWIGPVPPLPTELGRAWDCNLLTATSQTSGKTMPLWITAGVGETGPRARLFNPPTIDQLILTF